MAVPSSPFISLNGMISIELSPDKVVCASTQLCHCRAWSLPSGRCQCGWNL